MVGVVAGCLITFGFLHQTAHQRHAVWKVPTSIDSDFWIVDCHLGTSCWTYGARPHAEEISLTGKPMRAIADQKNRDYLSFLTGAGCIAQNDCYLGVPAVGMIKSSDGGQSWSQGSKAAGDAEVLYCWQSGRCLYFNGSEIMVAEDNEMEWHVPNGNGGIHAGEWKNCAIGLSCEKIESVSCFVKEHCIAVVSQSAAIGRHAKFYKSLDGGNSWSSRMPALRIHDKTATKPFQMSLGCITSTICTYQKSTYGAKWYQTTNISVSVNTGASWNVLDISSISKSGTGMSVVACVSIEHCIVESNAKYQVKRPGGQDIYTGDPSHRKSKFYETFDRGRHWTQLSNPEGGDNIQSYDCPERYRCVAIVGNADESTSIAVLRIFK